MTDAEPGELGRGRWKLACVAALPFVGSLGLWLFLDGMAQKAGALLLIFVTLGAWMWATALPCSACGSLQALKATGGEREFGEPERSLASNEGYHEREFECRYCAAREWRRCPKSGWTFSSG